MCLEDLGCNPHLDKWFAKNQSTLVEEAVVKAQADMKAHYDAKLTKFTKTTEREAFDSSCWLYNSLLTQEQQKATTEVEAKMLKFKHQLHIDMEAKKDHTIKAADSAISTTT
jgi:hypothetical protein